MNLPCIRTWEVPQNRRSIGVLGLGDNCNDDVGVGILLNYALKCIPKDIIFHVMKGLSGKLLGPISLTLISVFVIVVNTLSVLWRVTLEQETDDARYEIISHLLNVPLFRNVTHFILDEFFPTFRNVVMPLFQGQTVQAGGKTIVLNVWSYSSKHTASHPRKYEFSRVVLAVAIISVVFFCVNDCR